MRLKRNVLLRIPFCLVIFAWPIGMLMLKITKNWKLLKQVLLFYFIFFLLSCVCKIQLVATVCLFKYVLFPFEKKNKKLCCFKINYATCLLLLCLSSDIFQLPNDVTQRSSQSDDYKPSWFTFTDTTTSPRVSMSKSLCYFLMFYWKLLSGFRYFNHEESFHTTVTTMRVKK